MDPIALGPWADETLEDLEKVMADPQLRLLMGAETIRLIERMRDAPRRESPIFKRVRRADIDPTPFFEAPEGHFRDAKTGGLVVYEDHPSLGKPYWVMEKPHPKGAFTFGELARLEALLWAAGRRMADEREFLSHKQREWAAHGLVEAADTLSVVIALHQVDPETAEKLKRKALEILAREDNPTLVSCRIRALKRRLMK